MLLLENSLLLRFRIVLWAVMSSSFFIRWRKEREGGDGCCASDVHEFIYRGTSIFAMGPSRIFGFRDEARLSGRIGMTLASAWSAHMVSDQIRPGGGWGSMPLFPHSVHGAGSICVLDDGFDSWGWSSALMLDAAALSGFAPSSSLELQAWRYILLILQASICSSKRDLPCWRLPGSSGYHCPPRNDKLFV